jgi:phage gpG-like protein
MPNKNTISAGIAAMIAKLENPEPLMAEVAEVMLGEVLRTFDDEGPNWAPLAQATIEQLERRGKYPRKILAPLRPTIKKFYGKDFAAVGSDAPFAIYHQLGTSKIPQRAFLILGPITEKRILEAGQRYLGGVL